MMSPSDKAVLAALELTRQHIELQKRLALAEAKLEAVRRWNTPDPNEWTTCRFHHLKKILDDQ